MKRTLEEKKNKLQRKIRQASGARRDKYTRLLHRVNKREV